MLIISESLAQDLVSIEDAIEAVAATFIAMAQGKARNYPVVREVVGHADAVYGVKAGGDISAPFLGLKAGGYWPHNLPRGLTNHQSSTLMFDPETGRASGLVSANYLTGVRTGAASALATRALSRADATVLGIIGTGGQSVHQLRATAKVRGLTRVHAWDPMPENVARFAAAVTALGLEYVAETSPQAVAETAEIIVTVTPSQKPILLKDWIRPGTHISAMGADTKGKQELDPALVAAARVFVDEAAQAISIGECQHAYAQGMIGAADLTALGAVLEGRAEGRRSEADITLFDGTGVALQDLVVADLAMRRAIEAGRGVVVDY
ncbi:MAG: ornithine cyclodeaminase [Rhodobacteraceae bacterium]|uniref:ornithine cyclodeaminase family protein n=1 Tax=Cypionkella sp. TaxID=2811411 RepID=UPI001324B60A|nr:ornithine cyclodeaminase family protein [Cypionkella sp.]KAF0173656.1 MAG: ornithine cyclodeaminase [Paracoccaceae bacterium]MDO8325625.1 ornithine cyclodeaminase family protein [Cypionkella sp.]